MSCVQGRPWSVEEKRRLQSFAGKKDRKHAPAAFPDRTPGAVFAAIARCASRDTSRPPIKVDGAAARAGIRALPLESIAERLPDLMKRGALFERPHTDLQAVR